MLGNQGKIYQVLYFIVASKAKQKKDVYAQSVTKAFKPMIDILEAILNGAKPLVIILTAFSVVIQLLKAYQNFQRGDTYQKQAYAIIAIVFCSTLIMTYSAWLIPILKKVAGI